MKDEANTTRSRDARLNQAARVADRLHSMTRADHRPTTDEAWAAMFQQIRTMASEISQCVHEASAYHTVVDGSSTIQPDGHGSHAIGELGCQACEMAAAVHLPPVLVSAEEIADVLREEGTFTRETLARWCVPYPPPKGWKKAIMEGRRPWIA